MPKRMGVVLVAVSVEFCMCPVTYAQSGSRLAGRTNFDSVSTLTVTSPTFSDWQLDAYRARARLPSALSFHRQRNGS